MLRIALIYHLLIAFAAGPWLCCCVPARLGRLIAVSVSAVADERTCPRCCDHHASTAEGHRQPPDRPGNGGPCPCKKSSAVDVAAGIRELGVFVPDLRPVDASQPPTPTSHVVARLSQSAGDDSDAQGRFPATDDLLFSHHKLRC